MPSSGLHGYLYHVAHMQTSTCMCIKYMHIFKDFRELGCTGSENGSVVSRGSWGEGQEHGKGLIYRDEVVAEQLRGFQVSR